MKDATKHKSNHSSSHSLDHKININDNDDIYNIYNINSNNDIDLSVGMDNIIEMENEINEDIIEIKEDKDKNKKKKKNKNDNKNDTNNDDNNEYIYYIVDDIVYFQLKGRAKENNIYAFVSLNKWNYVKKYQWYLGKCGYPLCYYLGKMKLHRFIFTYVVGDKIPSNVYVDHIDRNKLNNTDGNLRLASPQENSFNKSTKTNKKGVKKISTNNYSAIVTKDGKKHEIKNIPSEEQAASIYNMMAEELFGSFAAFNEK